ncbi:unnamed protein product [Paramecium sonneborni]|uniref:Transmembrane protein n=1 Tax=Paramecium sonneborni TaxID=65129 RepID=A0A8S1R802_9CILI|nr:unnamed protein product [Paramecium sonneborni]
MHQTRQKRVHQDCNIMCYWFCCNGSCGILYKVGFHSNKQYNIKCQLILLHLHFMINISILVMQLFINQLKQANIEQLVSKHTLKDIPVQLKAIRLSYEIENKSNALLEIYKCRNRNDDVIRQAIQIVNQSQFDNEEIVKNIRIEQFQYRQKLKQIQQKYFLKMGLLIYGLLFGLHLGVQGWYYLEYDLWLSNPGISEYHTNRFR